MPTEWTDCVSCGHKLHRDGFSDWSAELCWGCAWRFHMDREHPLTRKERRKIRRAAKAAAKVAAEDATRSGQAQAVISAARAFDDPPEEPT